MSNVSQIKTMYRHDFNSFNRFAFKELNPYVDYLHNFHIDLVTDHLALCESGKIKRLLINLPPRYLKSNMASIAFPAWVLGRNPQKKIICIQGEQELASQLEASTYNLMTSGRYINLFPHMNGLLGNYGSLITPYGGYRQSVTTTKSLTGKSADIIIIDDPISTQHVSDPTKRDQINRWYDENIQQRLNNRKDGVVIVVMQRLHPEDLSNYLLSKNEGWVHLNLPAIAMEDETWKTSYGRTYTRAKGEALHPARESREDLCNIMISIGGWNFALQYLQGTYKPRFNETGHGAIWLSALRNDVRWYPGQESALGFYQFTEERLMLPKVFNIGEDPCPPDMRHDLTPEEFTDMMHEARQNYEKWIEESQN